MQWTSYKIAKHKIISTLAYPKMKISVLIINPLKSIFFMYFILNSNYQNFLEKNLF